MTEPSYQRIVRSDRSSGVIRRGRRRGQIDFYYGVLTVPIWGLLIGMGALFVALNASFAGLYMLEPGSLSGDGAGRFWPAFFMSVQQFSGTGLSEVHPQTFYGHMLASSETFFGLVNLALMTGLLFDRVSRPTARIMFSDKAVITEIDGQPHFLFRAANQRANQILEAEVTVTLARQATTKEGQTFRRFEEMKTLRGRSPLFLLTWSVMHPIDQSSPLYGADRESLRQVQGEIIVVMSGVDETLADRVHARRSYLPDEIEWNRRFVDVLSTTPDGRRVIDYSRFHDLQPPGS